MSHRDLRGEKPREGLALVPIAGLDDPRLPAVAEIWQVSFPPEEMVPVASWIALLKGETAQALLAAVDPATDETVGLAWYEARGSVAALWYLAVAPGRRNGGIGAALYAALRRRLRDAGVTALVWEVEVHGEFAQRRIAWYRRQGAQLLGGVDYVQSVGWQPPVAMHLMLDSDDPLTPEDAHRLCEAALGTRVPIVGELTLA